MKLYKLPALLLAIVLQFVPVCRVACVNSAAASPGLAIVFRWLACAVTMLGSYHTVSAASAAIAGLANTNPRGPVTTNATGKLAQPFSYRIIVTNPGIDATQDYYDAAPLPPGLTINKAVGGNGYITGTPTAAGAFPVTLTAGNKNSPIVVHLGVTITIDGGVSPPGIASPPTNQIVLAGTDVSFSVTANGSGVAYQWRLNGNNLANANAATLTLTKATTAQSGLYSVVVSNSAGTVMSGNAQLLVVPPPGPSVTPALRLVPGSANQVALSFAAASGYRYVAEYSESLSAANWIILTNRPPAFTGATVTLDQSATAAQQRFYRARVQGP